MELFKKKKASEKAVDILANALHDDEISSYIVIIYSRKGTTTLADGDLFSQAMSLISSRKLEKFKKIELLADVIEKAMEDEERKEDGKENPKDTPGDGEI